MRFGQVITNSCANVPPPPDSRCEDEAFALANPNACPAAPSLIIKPAVGLVCLLGSIQLKAFLFANGTELDVTADTTFVSSDNTILVIGTHSGNATGVAIHDGNVTVTATHGSLTAASELTVLGSGNCCVFETVAIMVVVDNSKSMSQSFGGSYTTRLAFAKAAATQFIGEVNQSKDIVGLMNFNALDDIVLSPPIANKLAVQAMVAGIVQTQQSTAFFDALTTAVAQLDATSADKKLLVLISDGEDQQPSYLTDNPIGVLEAFKNTGGVVLCLGCRASGSGYSRLEKFSTGGFFINAYGTVAAQALALVGGLKGYVCAGNCNPVGDVFEPTPELAFNTFTKWNVQTGTVDLIGPGLFDVLPGNGLYVAFDSSPYAIVTKDSFALSPGNTYRVRLSLAGNQKTSNGTAAVTVTIGTAFSHTILLPDFAQDFSLYSFNFDVPASVTGAIQISSTIGDATISQWGPLLGEVSLDNVTDGINLFSDDFASENILYVPPRCGPGTVPILNTITNAVINYNSPVFKCTNFGGPAFTALNVNVGTLTAGGNYDVTLTVYNPNYAQNPPASAFGVGIDLYALVGTVLTRVLDGLAGFTPQDGPVLTFTGSLIGIDAGSPLYYAIGILDPGSEIHAGCLGSDMQYDDQATSNYPVHFNLKVTNGTSSITYGYAYGYDCYGTGCLSTPPPAQLPDPTALPDIEKGFTPPKVYNSTQTACVSCPAGFANFPTLNLVPVMTSDTAPSGEAEASDEIDADAFLAFAGTTNPVDPLQAWFVDDIAPQWLQYKFDAQTEVHFYSFTAPKGSRGPAAWMLQGSNDGTTWTTIDEQLGMLWVSGETKRFGLDAAATYQYFRLYIITMQTNLTTTGPVIAAFELFAAAPAQICISQSATSDVSQAAADKTAYDAAALAAQSQLNCVQQYSASESVIATCPVGSFGNPVTSTASATSFNSQDEADRKATAIATLDANALLDCSLSNNTNSIAINDALPGNIAVGATPYPSVQHISGMTGVITNVSVAIIGLAHTWPQDIKLMLRGPTGAMCELMRACGGNTPVTGKNITFDDASAVIPGTGATGDAALVSGTFHPTQLGVALAFPAPAPAAPYSTSLGTAFNGTSPNGSWSLWASDRANANSGTIVGGFALTFTLFVV